MDHLNTLNLGIYSSSVIRREGFVFPDISIFLGASSHKSTSADCNILLEPENEEKSSLLCSLKWSKSLIFLKRIVPFPFLKSDCLYCGVSTREGVAAAAYNYESIRFCWAIFYEKPTWTFFLRVSAKFWGSLLANCAFVLN